MKYINAKAVVTEYLKIASPDDEVNRTLLMGFVNDATDKIISSNVYDFRNIVLPITNYGAELPKGFASVRQALYKEDTKICTKREEVIEWTQEIYGTGCHYKITKECPKCKAVEPCNCGMAPVVIIPTHLWHANHGEQFHGTMALKEEFTMGQKPSPRSFPFRILHRTTNNFHTITTDLNDDCKYPSLSCRGEYSIRDGDRLITSFKEGEVLLAYKSKYIDEDGYLMVPDDVYAISAITSYVSERKAFSDYSRSRSQADRAFWSDMVQMAERDMKIARNKLNIPAQDKFEAWLDNHWKKYSKNNSDKYNLGRYKPDEYKPYTV